MSHFPFTDFGKDLSSFVVGPEGNISCRLPNGNFMIKASGSFMSSLTQETIVTCDIDGNMLPKQQGHAKKHATAPLTRPSMEVGFHSWLYKNTDCEVIAHTHPINVMKVLCGGLAEEFAKNRMFPDQVVFNGINYGVVPYATPGDELVSKMINSFKSHKTIPKVILLENHGLICCAKDFKEAVTMTEICDKAAEIFLEIQKYKPSYLSQDDISKILGHESEAYRKSL
tara:strand:- start:1205 stop:1885 length:681 start_codon:yes stop_codon:yes gene_type:complete